MTSESTDELAHLEELAALLQRRRRILEIQRVRFGDLAPASIVLELEDTEQQLAQIQADLRRMRPSPAYVDNPYLGLLTFQEDDSTFFFGRDALIGELLSKAEQSSFLAVLGPSGSGKSSVVRAGLIPALKRGALPGSDQWCYLLPLKPGARPLNALAATLAAAQDGRLGDIAFIHETLSKKRDGLLLMADGLLSGQTNARLVLVVDQAEELWTLAPIEPAARTAFITDQQQPFIRCLLAAAEAPDHPVLTILTMRADFLHRALEHQDLASWTKMHNVLVEPLTRDELHSAITRPADLVGAGFEPGLVDTLVEQTVGRPGALPLLEYTLLELWKDRRPDGTLTWEAFKHIGGGVEGGLARRADSVLAKQYTPEQQAELRAVLLHLVQPGEGTVDTRRRVPLDDLVPAGSSTEAVHALLKPLADERLITTGYNPASNEEIVEVSHEALIRAWPTLGAWINMARGDLRLQIQLGEAARDWVNSGENPDLLWSGLRLDTAEAWLDRARPRLNMRDQRFLDASHAYRQAEVEAEQARIAAEEAARQRELEQARALAAGAVRLRRRAQYLAGAFAATLLAIAIAGWYWYRATRAQERAFAQYLVAKGQAVYDDQPLLGVRLATEGLGRLPQNDLFYTDLMSTTVELIQRGRLRKLGNKVSHIYASDDSTAFVFWRPGIAGELCYTNGGPCERHSALAGRLKNVTFSPDGKLVFVSYEDKPPELRHTGTDQFVPLAGVLQDVTFSPDSRFFIVSYQDGAPSQLRHSDTDQLVPLAGVLQDVTFSPDSKSFVVSYKDGKLAELRHTGTDQLVPLAGVLQDVTFSPDSKVVFVSYEDKPGELRHTGTDQLVPLAGVLKDVRFSDSKSFVVSYKDGAPSELRRTDTDQAVLLAGKVYDVTFSPDDKLVFVSYEGKPPELRHIDSGQIVPLSSTVLTIHFSPDSKSYHVAYADGKRSELRRTDTDQLVPLAGFAFSAWFSPDSKLVFVAYSDKPSELRHIDTGQVVSLAGKVKGITFSPDNRSFVVEYEGDGKPRELRHTDTDRVVPLVGMPFEDVKFSPDSKLLFVSYTGRSGEVWHTDTNQLVPLAGDVTNVTFNPDSKLVFVSYTEKPGELWTTGDSPHRLLSGITDVFFAQPAPYTITRYTSGEVYLLDPAWFSTIAGYPQTLSEAELIKRACTELLSSARFDEQALQPYLGNQEPQACR